MTPQEATKIVSEKFPFEGYLSVNEAPYITVGRIVEQYLKPEQTLLDFGSGPCDKTAVAKVLGANCIAFDDLGDNWHKQNNTEAQIKSFASEIGIRFTDSFEDLSNLRYDMIMLNDVLEHFHDSPRELLNKLLENLNSGGYLFVTVPNLANIRKRLSLLAGKTNLPSFDLYYWYPGNYRGPIREYVRGDLELLAQYLGLSVVELTSTSHMLGNLPARLRGPYELITKVFPDWRDTWLMVAQKPVDWSANLELDKESFLKIYGKKSRANLYD